MEQPLYPAKQLRLLKDHYGLTVEQISKKSGVSVRTVCDTINGKGTHDLRVLRKIADALNADVDCFLRARDPKFTEYVQKLISDISQCSEALELAPTTNLPCRSIGGE